MLGLGHQWKFVPGFELIALESAAALGDGSLEIGKGLRSSDDLPHAPWCTSATHGTPAYPWSRPSGTLPDAFNRKPYHSALRTSVPVARAASHDAPNAAPGACR